MESTETTSSDHRVVRRASSAGESNTCPPEIRMRDKGGSQYSPRGELQNYPDTKGQDGRTPFRSSTELTMDDIDHVHGNTSSEDLKLMVAPWEAAQSVAPKSARDSVRPQSTPELAFSKGHTDHEKSPLHTKRGGPPTGRQVSHQSLHEPEVVEEKSYDTIWLPDPPSLDFNCSSLMRPRRSAFLGLEANLTCCHGLRPLASQDSLQLSKDKIPYHQRPLDNNCLSLLYNSFS
ncbi:pleckstrin homology domain-containing family G member 1-like [Pipistrellus kuhlii]|uniref:pleckstrin homology domain-containing family G member 1-like n=1 Tax=Pipistrellus kuhlii TaxID=59472 RepID=UPI001E27353A|nr:pleckstrin homology domain-containing family G member 1-like [Pipistrellus kuhlii]